MNIVVKCNGKINPVGIENKGVRFSLDTVGIERIDCAVINFYKSESDVNEEKVFRSEEFNGRLIRLDFEQARACEELFYKVTVRADGKQFQSEVYKLSFALIDGVNGAWIDNADFDGRVLEFLKTFSLSSAVKSAKLFIVGLGYYCSSINGVLTDDEYYKPLLSDYDKREKIGDNKYDNQNFKDSVKTVYYDSYDVTDLLVVGENSLNVLVGTGWYYNTDKDITDPSFSFNTPKLFFELHVKGEDYDLTIKSDDSTLVRNTNAYSQLYKGDNFDFSKDAEQYIKARVCEAPTGKLVPSTAPNDRVIETIAPITLTNYENKILYDFGKNHSGGLRLKVKGNKGDKLIINHYESLKDGVPNPRSSRWIAYLNSEIPIGHLDQTSEYVLSGGVDEISPLFHFDCYRYAEIEKPDSVEILEIESLFIATFVEENGYFRCAYPTLNNIYTAFVLTQRDNMHSGVPSDCPHREKIPYTGDGQLACESTIYALDTEEFYRKWLKDILDAQGSDGFIPYSAPFMSGGGGYWWSNALTTVALTLYKYTGDKKIIEECFPHVEKFMEFYARKHNGTFVVEKADTEWFLGDWLAPEVIKSDTAYVNAMAYYSASLEYKTMCEILGKKSQIKKAQENIENIKNAVNLRFFDEKNLKYGYGEQGEDVLALAYDIVPEQFKSALWEKVVNYYKQTGHFDTGIVITPILLNALTENGYANVALKLMMAEDNPSFYHMLKGETTLSEHWSKFWPTVSSRDGNEIPLEGDVSHCHPMFGSVVTWMYKHVAGLDLSNLHQGKIIFAPKLCHVINKAQAYKQTSYGRAGIEYESDSSLNMKIEVPFGLEAEVRIPIAVCESFYVHGLEQLKSRKKNEYSYVKLTGGSWKLSSDLFFGEKR